MPALTLYVDYEVLEQILTAVKNQKYESVKDFLKDAVMEKCKNVPVKA